MLNYRIECPAGIGKEIDNAVLALADDDKTKEFRTFGELLLKTGLGQKGAREKLLKEFSEKVSSTVTDGVIQITFQELEKETEIKAKITKVLDPFPQYIDVIFKAGAMEVATLRYWFIVKSRIELNDLKVVVQRPSMLKKESEITGINAGTLNAFISLDFLGHDPKNPNPYSVFKDKQIAGIDLAKVIKFEVPKAA